MQRTKMSLTRLIASLTVLMLLAVNFLPSIGLIAYAVDSKEEVEISGFFQIGDEEKATSAAFDVTEENAKLILDAKVNGRGYIKSGIFEIEPNANFEVKENSEIEVEDNRVNVKIVDSSNPDEIILPIEFRKKPQYELDYFNKANRVTFTGIYVNNDGEEQKIQEDLWLELGWSENIEVNVENEVIKNIEYEQEGKIKRIVQSVLKISDSKVERKLPVQKSHVEIEIPQIADMNLVDVNIDAEKLLFSQGTEDEKVVFDEENFSVEENLVKIDVPQLDDSMISIDGFGEDIYVLTFAYEGTAGRTDKIETKVKTEVEGFTGVKEEKETTVEYDLGKVTKKLVSYYRENKTDTISQGYLIADSIQNRYDISYNKKDVLNINRADLVSGLEIKDTAEYFVTEDGRKYELNSNYSSMSFRKDEIGTILGNEGKLEILDKDGNVLATVKENVDSDSDGNIIVGFSEPVSKVDIRTTEPVQDGKITVLSTKHFDSVSNSKAEIAGFTDLINESTAIAYYSDGNYDDLGKSVSSITVTPTISDATLSVSNNKFSTVTSNEGVNFQIYLNNSADTSDLYENPVFEIRFPQAVTDVRVSNMNLFYANNELSISNVEVLNDNDGRKVLRVSLAGNQVSYDLNAETNGTVVSLDTSISIDEFTTGITEDIEMLYANFAATGYTNSSEWRMLGKGSGLNGVYVLPVKYNSPEGLVNAQTTEIEDPIQKEEPEEIISEEETKNDEEEASAKVISIKQGVQDELLEEGVEAQLATMTISVLNNTNKRYTEFSILGRIPFAGNKDVRTGQDLGTTVDTILDTEIVSDDPSLIYDVYYSQNPDATEDLFDENNGWTMNYGKSGTIKSYLIVIDPQFVLEPSKTLQFEYDYVIPANLQPGDALYGTYASFYKEIVGDNVQDTRQANESADAVGYRTEEKATVELNVNQYEGNGLQGLFDATFEIAIKNTSEVDAKDVYVQTNMPDYLDYFGVTGADASATTEGQKLQLYIPLVKAHEERSAYVTFNVENVEETKEDKLTVGVFGNNLPEIITEETDPFTVYRTDFLVQDSISHQQAIAGSTITNVYTISNSSEQDFGKLVITKDVSDVFEIEKVNVLIGDEGVSTNIDNENHKFTVTVDDFNPDTFLTFEYVLKVNFMDTLTSLNATSIITTLDIEGRDQVTSETPIAYYEPVVSVKTIKNNETGFSEVGETLDYEYEIINDSDFNIYTLGLNLDSFGDQQLNYIQVTTPEEEKFYDGKVLDYVLIKLGRKENAKVTLNVTVNQESDSVNNELGVVLNGKELSSASYETSVEDNADKDGHSIVGMAFLDRNNNNKQDSDEEVLDGIIVNLYDSITNELVESTITNVGGRYEFKNKEDGRYYVKFNYDESKYRVNTGEQAKVLDIKNKKLTDNINVSGKSIADVDLSLTDENVFDLSLDAKVEKLTVQNKAENTNVTVENNKLAKVDINPEIVENSRVIIEYKVIVKNQGSVPGKVNKIVDYIPDGFEFDTTLNPDWYMESDGNVYTRSLVNDYIMPGEQRELSLVLVRVMTGENTGLAHNSFEIVEATNYKGLKDIDSTPNNRLNEDDFSSADVIIGISTGVTLKMIPVIMGGIIVAAMIGVLVWRIIDRRRYV